MQTEDERALREQETGVQPTPLGQMIAMPPPRSVKPRRTAASLGSVLSDPKARIGVLILLFYAAVALFAPLIAPGDPNALVDLPRRPPSAEHLLGTTGQGQDVFTQMVWGTRSSLLVGLVAGLLTTLLGVSIGMAAGYFGGRVDDVLSLITNIFLIIPGLPLLVVMSAFLPASAFTVIFVLAFIGWAGPARVLRSQTLSLREKDFVSASIVGGDSPIRIIFVEILPNMLSIVVASLFGAIVYAISAEAGLAFLGLGNFNTTSWGTILYWSGNNAGLLTGAWWTFVPPGLSIALVAFAFAMINYSIDQFTNPRLRAQKELASVIKKYQLGPRAGSRAAGRAG